MQEVTPCASDPNIKDKEYNKNEIPEMKMPKQDINHTEEVTEQGTTFPTKIGTLMCNALIDTGATRSCISEKYYQNLPSTKIHQLKNISVRSATGTNLTPLGMINCSFELGKIRFNSDLIVCRNLTRPLILGRHFLYEIISWYNMLMMENVYLTINNMN